MYVDFIVTTNLLYNLLTVTFMWAAMSHIWLQCGKWRHPTQLRCCGLAASSVSMFTISSYNTYFYRPKQPIIGTSQIFLSGQYSENKITSFFFVHMKYKVLQRHRPKHSVLCKWNKTQSKQKFFTVPTWMPEAGVVAQTYHFSL